MPRPQSRFPSTLFLFKRKFYLCFFFSLSPASRTFRTFHEASSTVPLAQRSGRRNSLNALPILNPPPRHALLPSVLSMDTLLSTQHSQYNFANRLSNLSSSNTSLNPQLYSSFSASLENGSAASESESSEHPGGAASSRPAHERRKRKKKTLDRFPKLEVLDVKDKPVVECQLETIHQKTVTFRFDIDNDSPSEVTNNLVRPFHRVALHLPALLHPALEKLEPGT